MANCEHYYAIESRDGDDKVLTCDACGREVARLEGYYE